MKKSSGTISKDTFNIQDDLDWNPKMDDVEVTSRKLGNRRSDPVTDVKQRLSRWVR